MTSVFPVKAAKWQAVFPSGSQVAFTLAPRSRQLCATQYLITPCLFCFIFGISRPADRLFPLKFLCFYLCPPGKFGGNVIPHTTGFSHIALLTFILPHFVGATFGVGAHMPMKRDCLSCLEFVRSWIQISPKKPAALSDVHSFPQSLPTDAIFTLSMPLLVHSTFYNCYHLL
jgi:hypothetical protein